MHRFSTLIELFRLICGPFDALILLKAGSWEVFDVQTYVHDHGAVLPETGHCTHYVECGREHVAEEAGKMRAEGKPYKLADGDVMHLLFGKSPVGQVSQTGAAVQPPAGTFTEPRDGTI